MNEEKKKDEQQPKKDKNNKKGWWIVLGILVLLGVGCGLYECIQEARRPVAVAVKEMPVVSAMTNASTPAVASPTTTPPPPLVATNLSVHVNVKVVVTDGVGLVVNNQGGTIGQFNYQSTSNSSSNSSWRGAKPYGQKSSQVAPNTRGGSDVGPSKRYREMSGIDPAQYERTPVANMPRTYSSYGPDLGQPQVVVRPPVVYVDPYPLVYCYPTYYGYGYGGYRGYGYSAPAVSFGFNFGGGHGGGHHHRR